MIVSELIEFLKKQPQDLIIVYKRYSEQCILEEDEIVVCELGPMRPDGWVANIRSDKPSFKYLVFPGN